MNPSSKKMNHANPGIKCQVNTCEFYMQGDQCCADKIEVQSPNAMSSADTDCKTFFPQKNMYQ